MTKDAIFTKKRRKKGPGVGLKGQDDKGIVASELAAASTSADTASSTN